MKSQFQVVKRIGLMYSHGANQTFLIGTTHLKEKEHLEGGRIEGENIKAKLQTGELGLDMAEYMGEYKIIRRMDGGGNANVFVAENARGEEVAIKILREESGNGKKAVKRNRKKRIRFKIETEMVVGIQDEIKGVIPIFSYGLPDEKIKKYWYAMPIAIPLELSLIHI